MNCGHYHLDPSPLQLIIESPLNTRQNHSLQLPPSSHRTQSLTPAASVESQDTITHSSCLGRVTGQNHAPQPLQRPPSSHRTQSLAPAASFESRTEPLIPAAPIESRDRIIRSSCLRRVTDIITYSSCIRRARLFANRSSTPIFFHIIRYYVR